jgi:hypothetical protein
VADADIARFAKLYPDERPPGAEGKPALCLALGIARAEDF